VFKLLRSLLTIKRLKRASLQFNLDINNDGKNTVEVYIKIENKLLRIKNIHEIWDYGKVAKINGELYAISVKDLSTISAMRSLNPTIREDGSLEFDVCLPVLRYLRSKPSSIKETDRLQSELKISDDPLVPRAKVDYKPEIGLEIEAGYSTKTGKEFIKAKELKPTPDGGYAKVEGVFHPIAREKINPETKKWLEIGKKVIKPEDIPEFFKRDLVLLKTEMKVVLTEKASKIKIIDKPFKIKVNIDKNVPGWLDFHIDYTVGKYILPSQLIKLAKEQYVHPDENSWIHIDKEAVDKTDKYLRQLEAQLTEGGYRVPIAQFFSLEDFIEQIGGLKIVDAEYQKFLNELSDFQADEHFTLAKNVESDLTASNIYLRSYQRAGISWLDWLSTHYLHGILADDMGLGKTIQAIVTMRLSYDKQALKQHSLVICPKSVVHFWAREIKRCFPTINVYEYTGPFRQRNSFKLQEPIIFVSNYETITRDREFIHTIPFYFVVLDEATKIKNPDTQRTKAIKEINSIHRIALSGTPIENRAAELWSLFDFLMRGHLGSYGKFVRIFENPIALGDGKMTKILSNRIRPFVMRRLKKDVAKDLPEKIEMDEWTELTEEQKALYGQIQDQYVTSVRHSLQSGEQVNYATCILPILTKLKQVCDHPALITGECEPIMGRSEKFDLVVNKIQEICEGEERVVIFSHFLSTLDLLEIACKNNDISYIRLDGSTANRQMHIDRFNARAVDIALCSIQACGYGITLTAANHVVHINRWWNPAMEDQATDRVHRIGQDKIVYVYRILAKGTLEERIATLLESKRHLSDRVIGEATRQPRFFSDSVLKP